MAVGLVTFTLICVVALYFSYNPLNHSRKFMVRRFVNWFPMGMSYAFLYMARYNLNVTKNALGSLMNKESFGLIFGAGTIVYGLSFLLNGPLVDKIRILNTPASTLWFKTGQHSFLDSFIRYNSKYRDYLLGQKCVVMVPTLTGIIVPPRNGLSCTFVLTVCAV
jgi:hypothetical protein